MRKTDLPLEIKCKIHDLYIYASTKWEINLCIEVFPEVNLRLLHFSRFQPGLVGPLIHDILGISLLTGTSVISIYRLCAIPHIHVCTCDVGIRTVLCLFSILRVQNKQRTVYCGLMLGYMYTQVCCLHQNIHVYRD